MSNHHNITRLLSTKIPRPKNWNLSTSGNFKPLILTQGENKQRARPRLPPPERTPPEFLKHRQTLKKDFPEGWKPPKKLTRDAMQSLRTFHEFSPDVYTTPVLADKFKISPEAVRRILRSKWTPSSQRLEEMLVKESTRRTERRKERIMKEWSETVEDEVVDQPKEDKLELT